MADAGSKDTQNFYQNLGGINQKASDYAVGRAQFLDIRNMDFDVPNALQKRPGSTQAVTAGTSGAVTSLHEFIKLDGTSFVVAGTETAMFYLATNTYTLLEAGWSNGQPTDMLTFVNKLWMANGQKYRSWDGSTLRQAGLPCPLTGVSSALNDANFGTSWWFNANETMICFGTTPRQISGIYAAYGYVRGDGYYGPVDFVTNARNIATTIPASSGTNVNTWVVKGLTCPSGYGITAIAIYLAKDVWLNNVGSVFSAGITVPIWSGLTILPSADTSRFKLFTLIPTSTTDYTLTISTTYADATTASPGFTGMNFCYFDTYTPKYIEQNQNVVWMAGFSSAPSVLWFSELGQPERIEVDSSFEVRTNDGDRIMGAKAYNNQLIVFKLNSFHKVIGDSADNYQLVELSQQFGCLSNKTIIEYDEKLVWLDVRGIVRFDGAGWDLISTPVEDVFRRMNLSVASERAVAVHYKYRNQIWFNVPVDNSLVNNLVVVWDYLVDAWTFFEGFNVASASYVKGYLNRPTVWRGDYSGLIHYHGEIFYGDNGQGITCTATPHWDKQQENNTWVWRRHFLDVATVANGGTITGKVYANYDTATVRATYAIAQNAFQSRAEMGVMGKAVTTQWAHYSASLPLLINGFSWAKRFLRNV